MKTLKTVSMILAAALFFYTSCATSPVCLAPCTTHIPSSSRVENLGPVDGSDMTWSLLGLWMWGRPDIGKAITEARNRKQADALVNVRCYQTVENYLFFTMTTVHIEGEAIKISMENTK